MPNDSILIGRTARGLGKPFRLRQGRGSVVSQDMQRLGHARGRRGFEVADFRSHGFADVLDGAYMLTIVDRGADLLQGEGIIGASFGSELKAEARRRVAASSFYGHIAYASIVARKPPTVPAR